MNRKIKFRAWSSHTGMVNIDDNSSIILEFNKISGWNIIPNKTSYKAEYLLGESQDKTTDFHLMQYTGLKDCNGVEIYEGDICKCHYFYEALGENLGVYEAEKEIIGEIVFQEMGLWIQSNTEENSGYLLWNNGLHENSFEVLGNIYENPELLNK